MTYSIEFRKQVLHRIDDGLSVRQTAGFYHLSTSIIYSWTQDLELKKNQNKAPTKISNDVLLNDVKRNPDDYQYERARR